MTHLWAKTPNQKTLSINVISELEKDHLDLIFVLKYLQLAQGTPGFPQNKVWESPYPLLKSSHSAYPGVQGKEAGVSGIAQCADG